MAKESMASLGKVQGKTCYATPTGIKFGTTGKVRPFDKLSIEANALFAVQLTKGGIRKIRKGLRALGAMKCLYQTFGPLTKLPRRSSWPGASVN